MDTNTLAVRVAELAPRAHLVFAVPTLEYLTRGGRIGAAKAFVGSLLNVKPVLEVADGEIKPVARPRTMGKASETTASYVRDRAPNGVQALALFHAEAEDEHQRLADALIDSELAGAGFQRGFPVGAAIAAHTGPGVVGVAFVANP